MSRFSPEYTPNGNQNYSWKPKDKPKNEITIRPLPELEEFYDKYVAPNIEKNKIDEEDFEEVYSLESIQLDQQKIADRQDIFEKSALRYPPEERETQRKLDILAKEFEAICSDHSILSRGLGLKGREVKAQSASDYDDVMHQLDLILEFSGEKANEKDTRYFTFGIDVTISKRSFQNKFAELYRRFGKGHSLTNTKYFRESADGITNARLPKMGEQRLPRYIVNAKLEELQNLIDGWKMWRDNFKPTESQTEINALLQKTKIADNPIWYRMLHQIRLQAREFAVYFEKSDPDAARVYQKNYILISKILNQLTERFIHQDDDWDNKFMDIAREKDPEAKRTRYDLLRKSVHEKYRGEDMSYLARIITNKLESRTN